MKPSQNRGFSLIEWLVTIVLAAILASFVIPFSRTVHPNARQTKQISNAKQITLACCVFAADHAGQFPNGKYDHSLGKITDPTPAKSAEACFDDLIKTGKLNPEKIFWSPYQPTQCSPVVPDENGILDPEENCWDYIAGLRSDSPAHLPLVFEASDGGNATTWSRSAGHPWNNIVIVNFVDGSAERTNLNASGQVKFERDGTEVHACLPTPGKNGWPDTARLAPATPVSNPPK